MTHTIVVATPLWARDEDEEQLLRDSLRRLSRHGLPLVVADGGSREAFLGSIRTIPGLTLRPYEPDPSARLMSQVKAALAGAHALGPRHILYTEPDKRWFFDNRLGDLLAAAGAEPAGVLVAARDAASFATFPAGQRLTETLMNRLYAETFGQEGDYAYGPLLIDAALAPVLGRITEDVGWGWRFFLMAAAHRLGLPVRLWTAELPCPPEQRAENDARSRIYRMDQLAQNVKGLALGLKHDLGTLE